MAMFKQFEIAKTRGGYRNIEVEEIIVDDDTIIDYIENRYTPDIIFPEDKLKKWALDNGYRK